MLQRYVALKIVLANARVTSHLGRHYKTLYYKMLDNPFTFS